MTDLVPWNATLCTRRHHSPTPRRGSHRHRHASTAMTVPNTYPGRSATCTDEPDRVRDGWVPPVSPNRVADR